MGTPLTYREKQILEKIRDGCQYKEIAEELGLSVATIKTYVRFCIAKLGARGSAHAVVLSIRQGPAYVRV